MIMFPTPCLWAIAKNSLMSTSIRAHWEISLAIWVGLDMESHRANSTNKGFDVNRALLRCSGDFGGISSKWGIFTSLDLTLMDAD